MKREELLRPHGAHPTGSRRRWNRARCQAVSDACTACSPARPPRLTAPSLRRRRLSLHAPAALVLPSRLGSGPHCALRQLRLPRSRPLRVRHRSSCLPAQRPIRAPRVPSRRLACANSIPSRRLSTPPYCSSPRLALGRRPQKSVPSTSFPRPTDSALLPAACLRESRPVVGRRRRALVASAASLSLLPPPEDCRHQCRHRSSLTRSRSRVRSLPRRRRTLRPSAGADASSAARAANRSTRSRFPTLPSATRAMRRAPPRCRLEPPPRRLEPLLLLQRAGRPPFICRRHRRRPSPSSRPPTMAPATAGASYRVPKAPSSRSRGSRNEAAASARPSCRQLS